MSQTELLNELVAMSNHLGAPERDYAILGEGNTSARIDDESYFVKASGTELRTITADGFVQVRFDAVLGLLDKEDVTDDDVAKALETGKVDPTVKKRPSVETVLHALALNLDGVNFVGHTHPTAINAITCSAAFETAMSGRLFPDEVVMVGPAPVLVPYTDPGIPLARAVRDSINAYIDDYGEVPKAILMQNHGLIALGRNAQQVMNIHAMAVKAARILAGTYQFGGPRFMTQANVDRIHTRPDEDYRRKQLGE